MLIKEFRPNITYIKSSIGTIAGALLRINFNSNVSNKKCNKLFYTVAKIISRVNVNHASKPFLPKDIDNNFYPLSMEGVSKVQFVDNKLNNYL